MKPAFLRRVFVATCLAIFASTLSAQVIPGRYIAVLRDGVANPPAAAQALAAQHGLQVSHVYQNAIRGFAFAGAPQAAAALAGRAEILFVEPDQVYQIVAETVPTGIARANVPAQYQNGDGTAVNVDIAIIDTGIQEHPDLNVVGGIRYYTQGPRLKSDNNWNDGHGHGTHVGGTAAARNQGIGVAGVAPGARLWAVKVLGDNGSGSNSAVIAGVDWVTGMAATIEVANMSLGGGFSQALNNAVNNAVAAGVVMVVAAGNESTNAGTRSPASEPSAITVSALADFDGAAGGLSPQTVQFSSCTVSGDDIFACFSNYGQVVDICAPGVLIYSTYLNGGYATISGTSMASPHVAGAAALYVSLHGLTKNAAGVQAVGDALKAAGDPGPVSGDPDLFPEPVLNVSALFGPPPPPVDNPPSVTITSPANGSTVGSLDLTISANATDDGTVIQVEFFVDGNSVGVDSNGGDGWSVSWNTAAVANGDYTLTATARDNAGNATTSGGVTVTVSNVAPPPPTTMHVGALQGSSSNQGSTWTATVTVTILNSSNNPVAGANVSGSWGNGASGSANEATNANGQVTFSTGSIPKRNSSVIFTVTGVTHDSLTYDSSANVVNSIVVNKP